MSKQQLIEQLAHFTTEVQAIQRDWDMLLKQFNIASVSIVCGFQPEMTLSDMSKLVTSLRTRCMRLKLDLAAAWIGPGSVVAKSEQLQAGGEWLPMKFFGDYYKMKSEVGKLERNYCKLQLDFERLQRFCRRHSE